MSCECEHSRSGEERTAAIDPVCGMSVDPATAKNSREHGGETYFFCCPSCAEKFASDPVAYLDPGDPEPISGGLYTCPMHPEVVQQGPGSCPECGMALEPKEIELETAGNPELEDMERRFRWGAALALPVLLLAMSEHLPGIRWQPPRWTVAIQLVLTTLAVFWAGRPLLERGWDSLRNRSWNMFTLIGLGVIAAYGYSLVAYLAPGVFPPALRSDGGVPFYFEAAAVPWFFSARFSSCAPAARPAVLFASCWPSLPARRCGSPRKEMIWKSRSRKWWWEIFCECGPARGFRSTARSKKEPATSTSPW